MPPPKIVNRHFAALLFVQTISERRSSWLVHQAKYIEAREFAGVFGGLALRVIEVSGNGDDRAIDRLAKVGFGPVLEFTKNERGNFRWRENSVAEHDANHVSARGIDAKRKQLQFALHIRRTAPH